MYTCTLESCRCVLHIFMIKSIQINSYDGGYINMMDVSVFSWQWRISGYGWGRRNVRPWTRPRRWVDTGPQTWQFRGLCSHLLHPVSFLWSGRGLMTNRETASKASWFVQCSAGTILLFSSHFHLALSQMGTSQQLFAGKVGGGDKLNLLVRGAEEKSESPKVSCASFLLRKLSCKGSYDTVEW